MKKTLAFLCLILFFLTFKVYADIPQIKPDEKTLDNVGKSFEIIEDDIGDLDVFSLLDSLTEGNFNVDNEGLVSKIKQTVKKSLDDNYGFAFKLTLFLLLTAIADMLNVSKQGADAVKLLSVSIISLTLAGVFVESFEYAADVIDRMVLFINSLIPTLLTLLAASGGVTTAGVLNPVMLGVSSTVTMVVRSVIMPLTTVGFSLKICAAVTGKEHVSELGGRVFSLIKWGTGLVTTIYIGVITIVGTAAPSVDEITIKTAKYAVSSFVPYVGGMLSDSVELVLNCSRVVKNSVGILGLVGVLAVVVVPFLSMGVKILLLNLVFICTTPVISSGVRKVLKEVISALGIALGLLVLVGVMYIVSITVIIFIGGA